MGARRTRYILCNIRVSDNGDFNRSSRSTIRGLFEPNWEFLRASRLSYFPSILFGAEHGAALASQHGFIGGRDLAFSVLAKHLCSLARKHRRIWRRISVVVPRRRGTILRLVGTARPTRSAAFSSCSDWRRHRFRDRIPNVLCRDWLHVRFVRIDHWEYRRACGWRCDCAVSQSPFSGTLRAKRAAIMVLGFSAIVFAWLCFEHTRFGYTVYRSSPIMMILNDPAWYFMAASLIFLLASQPAKSVGKWLDNQTFSFIGKRSYGAYIVHQICALYVHMKIGPHASRPIEIALYFAATILVAAVSFRWLERPIMNLRERIFGDGGFFKRVFPAKRATLASRAYLVQLSDDNSARPTNSASNRAQVEGASA